MTGGRYIGGIGLEDQRAERQLGDHPPHPVGSLIGNRAADPDDKPEIDIALGLLPAAAEGVNDAAMSKTEPPHGRQHLVMCLAGMNQHRQAGRTSNAQLGFEQLELPASQRLGRLLPEIKANLTDRHHPAGIDLPAQFLHISGAVVLQVERMQAEGRPATALLATHLEQVLPSGPVDSRHDDFGDACHRGPLPDQTVIAGKFGNIEVAMGVDQFRNCGRCTAGQVGPGQGSPNRS